MAVMYDSQDQDERALQLEEQVPAYLKAYSKLLSTQVLMWQLTRSEKLEVQVYVSEESQNISGQILENL
jgi:hypothetical protein